MTIWQDTTEGSSILAKSFLGQSQKPRGLYSAQALLEEYENCKNVDETVSCLRALDAPHYHHELTKRTLLAAFEKPDQAPALLALLQCLTDTGVVSQVIVLPVYWI